MSKGVAILAVAYLSLGLCIEVGNAAGIATPNVTLEHGAVGLDIWRVSMHRPKVGPDASRRPCLEVLIAQPVEKGYEASIFEACGEVTPIPNAIEYSVGKGKHERTVIAMAFGVRVRKVMLDLGSRGKRRISPRLLPVAKAREAGLTQFRFGVVALAGSHCLHRVLGTEADGTVAIDQKHGDCAK